MDRNLVWAGALLLCIAVGGWWSSRPHAAPPAPSPSPLDMPATGHEVVSQYFEAVKSGDYRGAYALVAPFGDYEGQRLVKAGWSYERFARKAPDSPVPQEWTIKEVSDTGPDSRWVSVEIHPTPFWAMQVSFDGVHLVSIDGEWYLKEPPFLGVMPES